MAVPAVTATATDNETLQQASGAGRTLSVSLAIFGNLLSHGVVQRGTDDGRHGNHDLLVGRGRIARGVVTWVLWLSARGAQPWAALANATAAEHGFAFIGRICQQFSHAEHMPRFALGTGNALLAQASADLAQRQAIAADPLKDLFDHLSFLKYDLVLSLPATSVFADVPVTVWRPRQHIDTAPACRMPFAPTTPFHDLGPFKLGDHTLHLQQQVFFGADADGAVQEDDFNAALLQLLDQQHLPGIFASQAIRRMNIQPREATGPSHVAQSLQSGAYQRTSTEAVIYETQFAFEHQAVGLHPLIKRLALAFDRALLCLLLGGDTRVDGRSNGLPFVISVLIHGSQAPLAIGSTITSSRSDGRKESAARILPATTHTVGATNSYARPNHCRSSRPPTNSCSTASDRNLLALVRVVFMPSMTNSPDRDGSPQSLENQGITPAATPIHTPVAAGLWRAIYPKLPDFRQHCHHHVQRHHLRDCDQGRRVAVREEGPRDVCSEGLGSNSVGDAPRYELRGVCPPLPRRSGKPGPVQPETARQ